MKPFLRLSFIILLCAPGRNSDAQGLAPSTVRQIFSLTKGDSLQYRIWTTAQICQTVCNVYQWKVVDTVYYSAGADTLFIHFANQVIHKDSLANNPQVCQAACYNYVDGLVTSPRYIQNDYLWSIAQLDSSIIQRDTALNYWGSFTDSVVLDSSKYNGSTQNYVLWSANIMGYGKDVFADSLGPVYHEWLGYEASNAQNQELIYYHKANGSTWGQRYVYTGVEDVSQDLTRIYPNPVSGYLTIQSASYQDVSYELYDMLGQKVSSGQLTAPDTKVDVRALSSGIYLCQLIRDGQPVAAHKLIID